MPFSTLGLARELVKAVRAMGFSEPTAIQTGAIPEAIQGKDVIGCSQTGTGKTAAFVLPILQWLRTHKGDGGGRAPRALVLSPTRELCAQVETMARDMSRFSKARTVAVYGGVPIGPQQKALHEGCDLLVATPGRLLDLHSRGSADLSNVGILVLDEADRLLDMGFLPDLTRILRLLPEKHERQSLLFSATIPPGVRRLADHVLNDPVTVEVGRRRAPAEGIRHVVYSVVHEQKLDLLMALIEAHPMEQTLIFARTKPGADRVAAALRRANIAVARLHSNRTQQQRERALRGFRKGRHQMLVATDLASRGLDIEGITHVINYDVPQYPEDYVHRVGRTARAQAEGDAITLATPEDKRALVAIEQFIGEAIPQACLLGFNYIELPMEKSEGERLLEFARSAKIRRRRPSVKQGRQPWGARR